LHLILVFADDPLFVDAQIRPILWTSTEEFLKLLFNDEDWIEITVKAGTILPDDKVTEAEQAMELSKDWKITMELLYERIWIPNPQKEAEKFAMEQTINAIKAQKLQADAQAETNKVEGWKNEIANISKEIDNLWWWTTPIQA
jgi:hypothetical protein